jgi:hypothetical protein
MLMKFLIVTRYIRHWEDNYIFLSALHHELKQHNASEPLLIARWPHISAGDYAFPDGGSGWALSHGALMKWKPYISNCLGNTLSPQKARTLLGPESHRWANCKDSINPGLWCAEDVFLAFCLHQVGVKFLAFKGATGGLETIALESLESTFRGDFSNSYALAVHPVTKNEQRALWAKERSNNSLMQK